MFKLYGKGQRCVWCGCKDKENYKEITMYIKSAKPPEEKTIVCSDECADEVAKTCKFIEKGIPFFLTGMIIGIIASISGLFVGVFGSGVLKMSGIGLLILGTIFFIFPFVTPQTVKIFGLKQGMFFGRIGGIILFLLGIAILAKIL